MIISSKKAQVADWKSTTGMLLGARARATPFLSKDLQQKLNITLNLAADIPVTSGESSFDVGFGIRKDVSI